MEEDYKKKYLEYKVKYIELKKSMEKKTQSGGGKLDDIYMKKLMTLEYYGELDEDKKTLPYIDEVLLTGTTPDLESQRRMEGYINRKYRTLVISDAFQDLPPRRSTLWTTGYSAEEIIRDNYGQVPSYLLDLQHERRDGNYPVRDVSEYPRLRREILDILRKNQEKAAIITPETSANGTLSVESLFRLPPARVELARRTERRRPYDRATLQRTHEIDSILEELKDASRQLEQLDINYDMDVADTEKMSKQMEREMGEMGGLETPLYPADTRVGLLRRRNSATVRLEEFIARNPNLQTMIEEMDNIYGMFNEYFHRKRERRRY